MMDQLRRRRWRRRVAWAASLLLLLPDTAEPFLVPLYALSHDGLVADLRVVRVHDCRNGPQYHHSHNNHRAAVAGQDRWPFVVVDDRPHGADNQPSPRSAAMCRWARSRPPQTCLDASVPYVAVTFSSLAGQRRTGRPWCPRISGGRDQLGEETIQRIILEEERPCVTNLGSTATMLSRFSNITGELTPGSRRGPKQGAAEAACDLHTSVGARSPWSTITAARESTTHNQSR
jgi:hypothetical protein